MTPRVTLPAVAALLGLTQAPDLGTLCRDAHGRTNMWARRKPVAVASLRPITDEQRRHADYGLRKPDGGEAAMPTDAEWRRRVWTYAPPAGGSAQPFRLSDWDGYDPDARPPVSTPGLLSVTPVDTAARRFVFGPAASGVASSSDLRLTDLEALDDFYPCLVLLWTGADGTTQLRARTGSRTFGQTASGTLIGAPAVSITTTELRSLGTASLHYFMCACSELQTGLAWPRAGRYLVLPSARPLMDTITISDTLPLAFTFMQVAGLKAAAGGFWHGQDADRYNPLGHIIPMPDDSGELTPGGSTPDNYEYLTLGPSATVSLLVTVTNHGDSAVAIQRTQLYCRVARNLAGYTTRPTAPAALLLRPAAGGQLQEASAITVAAGASATYVIVWPDYCCVRNASGGIVAVDSGTRAFNAGFHLCLGNANGAPVIASIGLNIQK